MVKCKELVQTLLEEHSEIRESEKEILSSPSRLKSFVAHLKEHIFLEEEVIYPLVNDKDLINRALKEHVDLWKLLDNPDERLFKRLKEHMELEEDCIFPKLKDSEVEVDINKTFPEGWKPKLLR